MYNNFLYGCIKDALRRKRVSKTSAFTSVIVNYAIAIVAQLQCSVREVDRRRDVNCHVSRKE